MKKIFNTILILIVLSASFFGCGQVIYEIDDSKTQLYICVYNGGTGVEWIKPIITEWNQNNEKYEIILQSEKIDPTGIISNIESGQTATSPSMYFTSSIDIQRGIYEDLFMDLSDVLAMKAESDALTIGEKLGVDDTYKQIWTKALSKNGEGIYALPYCDSMSGFVFDFDEFMDKQWLYTADINERNAVEADGVNCIVNGDILKVVSNSNYYRIGDTVLSMGKDGKYDTYDDGQPQNITEWNSMVRNICDTPSGSGSNCKAYIWSGLTSEYLNHCAYALTAQYGGEKIYKTIFTHDSNGEKIDIFNAATNTVEPKIINFSNPFDSYCTEGVHKALEFMNSCLNNVNNCHPYTTKSTSTHSEAQGAFLLGYRGETINPLSAMIFEGSWWENEARTMFETIGKTNAERAYGKRRYRYMLYPEINGQNGIDGNGKGTIFAAIDSGGVMITKTDDTEKLMALKDFLLHTLSDKNLREFTINTGIVRPYKYDLTQDDRAKMTEFGRVVYDIFNDTQNIKIIRPQLDNFSNELYYKGGFNSYFSIKINSTNYTDIIKAFTNGKKTVNEILDGLKNGKEIENWNRALSLLNN